MKKLTFSTPCAFDSDTLAASFGFSDRPEPQDHNRAVFSKDVNFEILSGSYDEVLQKADKADAALVLLGNCGAEDDFVRSISAKLRCPVSGGAAAIDPVSGQSGLIFGRKQCCAVLFRDARYTFEAVTENIHSELLGEHSLTLDGKRCIARIDGQDALSWYTEKRASLGLSEADFEHLTFSDSLGVNAHLSVADGKLVSGRDLENTMLLRFARPESVYRRMNDFYHDDAAIVCGCAGLKGILPKPLQLGGCGLFLFGEVCSVGLDARFGNLMLSKLRITEK